MEQKFRVCIIGTGFGATVHAPMMQNHPGFEVAAIASVSRRRLEDVRESTGIQNVYDNWETMLAEEQFDLVAVTSNPSLHRDMTLAALERGLHVLCEKPMAMDAGQSAEMIAARDRAGRLGLINFEFRFRPARLKVRELIQSGKLGRILHITYRGVHRGYVGATTRRRYWLGEREQGGGMLGALGSHMFDSLMFLTGSTIADVTGGLITHVPEMRDEAGVEVRTADDAFRVIGSFANGTTYTAEYVYNSRHMQRFSMEVHGTEGTVVMTDDRRVEAAFGDDEELREIELAPMLVQPAHMPSITESYYGAFYPMLDEVYASLQQGRPTDLVPTFESGHAAQQVLDAIRRSSDEGCRIRL